MPPRPTYIPSLDGMRGIAFAFVFLAHAMPQKTAPGGFGVTVFFFLSGYLITTLLRLEAHNTETIDLKQFYLRRSLRILPPCYLTTAIVALLAASGVIYNTENYKSLWSSFFYFFNYWHVLGHGNLPAGLGVQWSLAIEEHYYLVFPFLYWWFVAKRTNRRKQALALVGLCVLALAWRCWRTAAWHAPWWHIYESTDTRFDSILYGCLLAVVANPRLGDKVNWLQRHANKFALSGLAIILLSFAYRNEFFRQTFRYTLLGIGLFPVFFLVALPTRPLAARLLENGFLRWLGRISYTMYLIHHPLFHHAYHNHSPSFWLAAGVFAASALYSQAMRSLVELPLQKLGRKQKETPPLAELPAAA